MSAGVVSSADGAHWLRDDGDGGRLVPQGADRALTAGVDPEARPREPDGGSHQPNPGRTESSLERKMVAGQCPGRLVFAWRVDHAEMAKPAPSTTPMNAKDAHVGAL